MLPVRGPAPGAGATHWHRTTDSLLDAQGSFYSARMIRQEIPLPAPLDELLPRMSPFAEYVGRLPRDGSALLKGPPERTRQADQDAVAFLERALDSFCLTVAGPPLGIDAATALAAALVYRACWRLVDRSLPSAELPRFLEPLAPPRSLAEHLSADLTLRFLPQVQHRAAMYDPAWLPSSPGAEFREAVWSDLGKDMNLLRATARPRPAQPS